MKKSIFNMVVFILAAAVVILYGQSPSFATGEVETRKSVDRLNIAVDERIELLSVIRLLSGFSEKNHEAYETVYKKSALDYFKKFKKHPAVELYKKMANSGFSYDAPPSLMLHLSWPDFKVKAPLTDYLITRARGVENLNKMAELFADFAKKTDFEKFFKNNSAFYGQLIADAVKAIGNNDFIAQLENYYGPGPKSYNIILAPILRRQGGYGPSVKSQDGKYDVYNIMGPVNAEGKNYDFGGTENYRSLVWHEFGHSFVNSLTELNSREVNLYKKLFEPISKKMSEQAYPDWETAVNEHIIRAVCARLTAILTGEFQYGEEINNNKAKGFAYIEELSSLMTVYEQQRSKYGEFKNFYPQIIALFKKLSESNLTEDYYTIKFSGSINAALSLKPDSYIIVIPDGEKDEKVNAQIVKCAEGVKKMFLKSSKILKGSEALKLDAKNYSFVAYGTREGNSFIKKHLEPVPVKIGSNEIELKEKYNGAALRFITCWPNPANRERAIVIYTAIKAEDVVNMNAVFHGPTDYVVADGEKVLKSANYKKLGGEWKLK